MQKSLQIFVEQLSSIRSGGIAPAVIDTIRVNNQPISHIASTVREGNRIAVIPWDRTILPDIDEALKKAGFNSYIFSKTMVVIGTSTITTVDEINKVKSRIAKLAEEARVAIRNIRQKARKKEDMDADEIQAITDEFIIQIDELTKTKLDSF